MTERRRNKRFKLEGAAFASLSSQVAVLGKIFDLSETGLSFSYVASRQRSHESPFLDIVLTDDRFRFRKLPFETVWDKPMFQEFSAGDICIRHCGVRFTGLTPQQTADLNCLIETCTPANTGP
jgi:hypothetical protein